MSIINYYTSRHEFINKTISDLRLSREFLMIDVEDRRTSGDDRCISATRLVGVERQLADAIRYRNRITAKLRLLRKDNVIVSQCEPYDFTRIAIVRKHLQRRDPEYTKRYPRIQYLHEYNANWDV